MYQVDIVNGNDENNNSYGSVFKTLDEAIKISNTGDTISVLPGTHDAISIISSKKHFEMNIKGSGSNTICSRFTFTGFFDFTLEDMTIENCDLDITCSKFKFKNVKFAGMTTIKVKKYEKILGNEHRNIFLFDNCKFENNFQVEFVDGNNIVSIKSCEIAGHLPLLICKSGTACTLKITNTNFEHPILLNSKSQVEIQHIGCNFICPLFIGSDTLTYTKDNYISPRLGAFSNSPETEFNITNNISKSLSLSPSQTISLSKEIINKYSEDVERYGGIEIDSNKNSRLVAHKVTEFIRVKGKTPFELILPKEPINGHLIEIYTDTVLIIDGNEYHDNIIKIRWTINGGFFFYK